MTYLKNEIQEPMNVYREVDGKWVLVFKGTNWDKGWRIADDLSNSGYRVMVK